MAITILRPGQPTPRDTAPGDFMLVHGTSPLSWLIQAGQRIRHKHNAARWTHAVCCDGVSLVEASAAGIGRADVSKYDERWRALVRFDVPLNLRDQAGAYLRSVVGQEYGFLDFASVSLAAVFGLDLIVTTGKSMICSQLVAQMLERCDIWVPGPPELVTPALLCEFAL